MLPFRLFLLIVLASPAYAEDLYLDCDLATGTNAGTSWANAWKTPGVVTFGTSAGEVGSGDTLYVSGDADGTTCNVATQWYPVSGTSGSPAIIRVGQDSGHNGEVYFDGGDTVGNIIKVANREYITIDGEYDGNRRFTFQNWGTGTVSDTKSAISGYGTTAAISGLTIKYVDIINDDLTCTTDSGCTTCTDVELKYCMYLSKTDGDTYIGYNYLEGCIRNAIVAGSSVAAAYGDTIIEYNTIEGYRNQYDNGGPDGVKGLGGTTVRYNTIYHETLTNAECNTSHAVEDGIQVNPGNNYVKIYGNTVYGYSQGAIRLDPSTTETTDYVQIYNNVVSSNHTSTASQRGIELGGQGETGFSNVKIFNNTIAGFGNLGILVTADSATTVDVDIYNNILYDSELNITNYTGSGMDVDYNLVIEDDGTQGTNDWGTQTHEPYDAGGTFEFTAYTVPTGSTNTTGDDFTLVSPSSMAIDQGLSSSLITDVLTDDIDGNLRTGTYDIGAYEYEATSGSLGSGWTLTGGTIQ